MKDVRRANPTLVFLHVPKTAGMTLKRTLGREYGSGALYSTRKDPVAAVERLKQIDPAERRKIKVIHGHMPFGIHEELDEPMLYMTMLRHPVERVVSHYYFVRRVRCHHLHDIVTSGMTLKEYVETGASGASKELDNGQTRLLSGHALNQVPFGECSEDMLHVARQNLDRHFGAVGLSERFDESLLVFRDVFRWRLPLYISRNVTRNRPRVRELDGDTLRTIERHNQIDLELYDYATRRLDAHIEAAGASFRAKLGSFRVLNRAYNRVHTLRQHLMEWAPSGRAS